MNNYFKHKMRKKSPAVIVGMVLFGIVAITGLAILFGFIIMSLWNWLMPMLFGLPIITYWQAVGLFILAKILFGFGGGHGSGHHSKKEHKRKFYCHNEEGKKRDFSKWEHYDRFWEEKGSKAYSDFVETMDTEDTVKTPLNKEENKQD